MNIKPLSDTVKDNYVKQNQQESRNRVNVDITADRNQAEQELDNAIKYIISKLNKK